MERNLFIVIFVLLKSFNIWADDLQDISVHNNGFRDGDVYYRYAIDFVGIGASTGGIMDSPPKSITPSEVDEIWDKANDPLP